MSDDVELCKCGHEWEAHIPGFHGRYPCFTKLNCGCQNWERATPRPEATAMYDTYVKIARGEQ